MKLGNFGAKLLLGVISIKKKARPDYQGKEQVWSTGPPHWKSLQLIQREADIIIFLSWFFLLFKVLSCFVCQLQKEYFQFCFGFSVPIKTSGPAHSHLNMISAYTPIARSPRAVGCIADDLFPHLFVYERAFVVANTFLFFKHIFVLSTVSPCVKVGIRSRFNSGCSYAVEDNLKFDFCSLPVLHIL